MDGRTFYSNIQSHDDLEWLDSVEGKTPADDGVIIGCSKTGHRFFFSLDAIKDNEWELLEDIVYGRRQATVMTHLARIVGYYSNLTNWNPSKKQEMLDRRRGNYIIPGDDHVYGRKAAIANSTRLPELRRNISQIAVRRQAEVLLA